ncbi:MAG: hypothetical protein IPH44_20110 [Myxococcales bacterium]|nr:hypothetical protein [Myxococcales bacterium]
MRRVTVVERGRLIRGEDESGNPELDGTLARRLLPSRLYDRLFRSEVAREDRGEAAVFSWRRDHCLVGPWVGVIQIPGLQIEILPKTDDRARASDDAYVKETRSNLMEMLVRGGLGAVRARGVADLSLKRGNLHDQLVDAFVDRVLYELRRGLDREYVSEESNVSALRGKLVLARHIAHNSATRHQFYCRHDVLSEATQVSIRIKQACRLVAGRSVPAGLQVKCQQVLALLDDVPDLSAHQVGSDPVFNRQNERFEDIYAFAGILLAGHAPDVRAGRVETFSLLFDMDQVFERYVAAFMLTQVIPRIAGARLFPQARGHRFSLYRDGKAQQDVLRMAPDLLFTQEGPGGKKTLIIDTKWKRLSERYGPRPSNDDLYQLYAYLHRYDCDRAFLLYPETDRVATRDLDALARHAGVRVGSVGLRFVDLSHHLSTAKGREDLAVELEATVREGFDLATRHESEVAFGGAE